MDETWIKHFQLPEAGNMMMAGPGAAGAFARQGLDIARVIRAEAERQTGHDFGVNNVLDLGCGVGRVALPLYYYTRQPATCVDVDKKAIAYLATQLPSADVRLVEPEPALPFTDKYFDVIFSVSLWTHLRPELAEPYLHEVKRLLKDDGVALITTAGYSAMASWKNLIAWDKSITPDDLRERGTIFYRSPGGNIGNAAHSPEYIQANWTHIFPRIETIEAVIGTHKVQDLNIMRK